MWMSSANSTVGDTSGLEYFSTSYGLKPEVRNPTEGEKHKTPEMTGL